jgi:hypothetical protein
VLKICRLWGNRPTRASAIKRRVVRVPAISPWMLRASEGTALALIPVCQEVCNGYHDLVCS